MRLLAVSFVLLSMFIDSIVDAFLQCVGPDFVVVDDEVGVGLVVEI